MDARTLRSFRSRAVGVISSRLTHRRDRHALHRNLPTVLSGLSVDVLQQHRPESSPVSTPIPCRMKRRNKMEWLTDKNGNRCSVEYFGSREAAQAALDGLKNCFDCSDCSYCSDCSGCSYCSRCSRCSGCFDCSDCSDCSGCSRCSYCFDYDDNDAALADMKKLASHAE